MGWLLSAGIILFLVLLSLILLLCVRVYMTIDYQYENGSDYLQIQLEILGFRVFHKELYPLSEKKGLSKSNEMANPESEPVKSLKRRWRDLKHHFQVYRSILPQFLEFISKISIHQFSWRTKLGLADAKTTGLAAGAGWGIKYSLIAWLRSHVKQMPVEEIDIQPLFQHEFLSTEAQCIFSFRLGKAIRIIRHIMKQVSGKTMKSVNEPVNT